MEKKESLRKEIKQKRSLLSKAFVEENSVKICRRLLELADYDTCLVYASANNEADLSYFIKEMLANGKSLAFPRVHRSGNNDMDFYKVDSVNDLTEGSFHIMEPSAGCQIIIPAGNTLCLVPGLAFSESGNRIGYGRGFYDNYLSRYKNITRLGIAFDFQICPDWETYSSDVPMDGLITEKREVFINDKIRRNM